MQIYCLLFTHLLTSDIPTVLRDLLHLSTCY